MKNKKIDEIREYIQLRTEEIKLLLMNPSFEKTQSIYVR